MNKKYLKYLCNFYILNILFTGCTSVNVKIESSINIPEQFSNIANKHMDIKNWWHKFNDNSLNNLIELALKNNLSIKQAQENYNAANFLYNVSKADLSPILIATHQYNKNGNSTLQNNDLNKIEYIQDNKIKNHKGNFYSTNFSAKWEVDIFGKKRSEKDVALYTALTIKEQIYTSELLITSKVIQNYISAASMKKRIFILNHAISAMQEQINYYTGRFNAGQTTKDTINQSQAALHKLKSKKETLLSQLKSIESSTAVLIAKPSQNFNMQVNVNILDKSIPIPSGIYPSELIYRRPDLRARKNIILTLMSKVASAKADLFPRFYINFLFNDGHLSVQDIAKTNITRSAFDFGLQLPIFTFGRIQNNILSANAKLKAAVHDYDNSLLQAINETDNLYYTSASLYKSINELNSSLNLYKKTINDKKELFINGFTKYDDVLNSKLNALNMEDEYVQNQLYLHLITISLYQALGGGWDFNTSKSIK